MGKDLLLCGERLSASEVRLSYTDLRGIGPIDWFLDSEAPKSALMLCHKKKPLSSLINICWCFGGEGSLHYFYSYISTGLLDTDIVSITSMDPVAAIGLTSNVVQFVDFSWRLLYDAKELYQSSTRASADNDILELFTKDIMLRNNDLITLSHSGSAIDPINQLTCQCKSVAFELLGVLDAIKVNAPHKKWQGFAQALRSVWKEEQIGRLVGRLEHLRDEIHFSLQIMLT